MLTDVEYTAKGKFKLPIAVVARQIGPIWNDYCGNGEAESACSAVTPTASTQGVRFRSSASTDVRCWSIATDRILMVERRFRGITDFAGAAAGRTRTRMTQLRHPPPGIAASHNPISPGANPCCNCKAKSRSLGLGERQGVYYQPRRTSCRLGTAPKPAEDLP